MTPNTESVSKPKGGRPRCAVTREEIQELRRQGKSWRQIASERRIGKTTASRYGTLAASLNVKEVSQNQGLDVPNDRHGPEPAQPSGERQHAGEAQGVHVPANNAPAAAANSVPAISQMVFPRIRPSPNLSGCIWPIDGKSPGQCKICGSNVWRKRLDGSCQCSICHPLTN